MESLKLKEYRLKSKLNQIQVAECLSVSQSMYSRFEKGKSLPNSKQIIDLCKLFNCTPNDLFGIQGAMTVALDPLFEDFKILVEKIKK